MGHGVLGVLEPGGVEFGVPMGTPEALGLGLGLGQQRMASGRNDGGGGGESELHLEGWEGV